MGNLVIFVVELLNNWLVKVTETFTDILDYYVLQMTANKFVVYGKVYVVKKYLNCPWIFFIVLFRIAAVVIFCSGLKCFPENIRNSVSKDKGSFKFKYRNTLSNYRPFHEWFW